MNTLDQTDVGPAAEASQWLVRLRDEPDNETAFNEWLRWRDADPANAAAYDRIRSLWHQFDQVRPDISGIDELLESHSMPATRRLNIKSSKVRWNAGLIALAAGCAAVASTLWFNASWNVRDPAPAAARENRSSVLPDGSAVDLGARTSVAVDFTDKTRLLRLSHGEAFFNVKKDPSRPFTVRAGPVDVIAVGTAFDVNHQPERIVVTVQEGMVAVKPPLKLRGTPAASWRVPAGYQFVYAERDATATLSSIDTSAVLAWREGRLEYARTPLSVVLKDINRYAEHPIVLTDASVGELTFTGTVFTDSIADWASALPGALPVTVRRGAGGEFLLAASGVAAVER